MQLVWTAYEQAYVMKLVLPLLQLELNLYEFSDTFLI